MRTNDLGAAHYTQTHEYGEAANAFGNVQKRGRSRGTPPSGTLPLRPRTSGGDRGLRGVVRRVLGRAS